MKHTSYPHKLAGAVVVTLLLLAGASDARGQEPAGTRRLVELLRDQLRDAHERIGTKDQLIGTQKQAIEQLQMLNSDTEAELKLLKERLVNMQREIDTLKDTRQRLEAESAKKDAQLAIKDEAIHDRDKVLQELVKLHKKSALEKFVESIPSIAGIIAIALVK